MPPYKLKEVFYFGDCLENEEIEKVLVEYYNLITDLSVKEHNGMRRFKMYNISASLEEAKYKARKMRNEKIKTLQKEINRLEKLDF